MADGYTDHKAHLTSLDVTVLESKPQDRVVYKKDPIDSIVQNQSVEQQPFWLS